MVNKLEKIFQGFGEPYQGWSNRFLKAGLVLAAGAILTAGSAKAFEYFELYNYSQTSTEVCTVFAFTSFASLYLSSAVAIGKMIGKSIKKDYRKNQDKGK